MSFSGSIGSGVWTLGSYLMTELFYFFKQTTIYRHLRKTIEDEDEDEEPLDQEITKTKRGTCGRQTKTMTMRELIEIQTSYQWFLTLKSVVVRF